MVLYHSRKSVFYSGEYHNEVVGTPYWMAPECLCGKPYCEQVRIDEYNLCMYVICCGVDQKVKCANICTICTLPIAIALFSCQLVVIETYQLLAQQLVFQLQTAHLCV